MKSGPRKVLHVLHAFSHGGLENGIVNIINASPPDLEHALCLLTTAGEFIHRLKKPVPCHELHKKPGNSVKTILQIRRIIRESNADIVHTRNWGAFDGVIAACLCPGVTLLHGEHGRDITDPRGINRRRNMLRRLFDRRIRKFTAVSKDLARWLHDLGIPGDKITLIVNGVDTQKYYPHRDHALRKELGISDRELVVGTIGRLDPVKNHAGLVGAIGRLAKAGQNVRLVIVGDGPERQNLQALARELALTPSPVFTGYRKDIERFYGIIDIFVLNSVAEGMSNTLLEAMACGLPVVCTPVGANVDIVEDGIRGRFVPVNEENRLAEALLDLINMPDLCRRFGSEARKFVEESHSLSHMIEQYNNLYLNI
ncbi:MAG: glycosyltransferase [Acidobacteria bacterium]|nr:glycosyltransferase [Acidobacteriota bacterium]